jgi:hypothetical protein
MADNIEFYKNLTPVRDFLAVGNASNYAPLPIDWVIVITDVVNSTQAIEQGKYKDVNTAGGLAAIALANALGNLDFPFIFGGDGVTMLLPLSQVPLARDVLASARALCKEMFDLTLRVGFVPMQELSEQGHTVEVLKFRLSDKVSQAILAGSDIEAAEGFVKDPRNTDNYLLAEKYVAQYEADFSGFVCSWLDIPSPKGETVSLIVKILEPSTDATEKRLLEILQTIHDICGDVHEHHPLAVPNLSTTSSIKAAQRNALVFNHAKKNIGYWRDFLKILAQNIILTLLPHSMTDSARRSIMADADFRKFDGSLKMVIACTSKNRQLLTSYFDRLHREGIIVYGIHVADRALMTCFLQSDTAHIHFIDAANGGYALAAKQLKQQLAALTKPSTQ